jgi:nucleotide-binding universal stress UspA family protein
MAKGREVMYKTISLHINDEARVPRLVSAGAQLAARFNAHLAGVCILPHIPKPPLPSPLAGSLAGQLAEAYREEAMRAKAAFESAVHGRPFVPEWRLVQSHQRSYRQDLLNELRTSDLIVASQAHGDWGFADIFDIPEEIALGAGRPVLIIPAKGAVRDMGERITVAWNRKPEAARAVFDALPLLVGAEDVQVVSLTQRDDDEGDLEIADILEALARHSIKCDGVTASVAKAQVGPEILRYAADHRSDLLIMGCYGRTRLLEFVLGGATRHVLHNMQLPVLMSH